jgi:aspartate/methionine/tyrosine aminotransferase
MVVAILAQAGMLISRPEGAFYILADTSRASSDSYALARRLVTEKQVAVAPGLTFGPSGACMVRLSLATDTEQLRIGTERLAQAVDEWGTG